MKKFENENRCRKRNQALCRLSSVHWWQIIFFLLQWTDVGRIEKIKKNHNFDIDNNQMTKIEFPAWAKFPFLKIYFFSETHQIPTFLSVSNEKSINKFLCIQSVLSCQAWFQLKWERQQNMFYFIMQKSVRTFTISAFVFFFFSSFSRCRSKPISSTFSRCTEFFIKMKSIRRKSIKVAGKSRENEQIDWSLKELCFYIVLATHTHTDTLTHLIDSNDGNGIDSVAKCGSGCRVSIHPNKWNNQQ